MISAESGAPRHGDGSTGDSGLEREGDEAVGQAQDEQDEWADILENLDDDEDQVPAKRPRLDDTTAACIGGGDQSQTADSVDDANLEGDHGVARPGVVRVPIQPTKEEVEEH